MKPSAKHTGHQCRPSCHTRSPSSSRAQVPWRCPRVLVNLRPAPANLQSKNLYILLHTLRRFMDQPPNLPPVAPSLPDMHSSTESYVMVQQLYKRAFHEDLDKFSSILADVLKEIGLPDDAIPENEVEAFVRNVGGVAIVKGNSLLDAKKYKGGMKERIGELCALRAKLTDRGGLPVRRRSGGYARLRLRDQHRARDPGLGGVLQDLRPVARAERRRPRIRRGRGRALRDEGVGDCSRRVGRAAREAD